MIVQAQEELGEGSTMPSASQHSPIIIQPSTSTPQKKQKPRKPRRQDTQEIQPSGPIPNVEEEAFNAESVLTHSNYLLPSGEDSIQLKELMEICTNLQKRVLELETTKTNQSMEIDSLKRRVKKLVKKQGSRTQKLKRLYKVGLGARVESSNEEQSLGEEDASKQGRNIADIDAYAKTTLVNKTAKDQESADKEVDAAQDQVSAATTTTAKDLTVDDNTLAKALEALKTSKPKTRGMVVRDHKEQSLTITTTPTSVADSTRPKARGIVMQEPKRLQAEEQEQLTDDEEAKLFMELLEKRMKFFAAKRAKERRNRPPTKAQQRILMCTYLNNMDGSQKKVDDDQEATELKKCFEIVPDDEDDVNINATPLSSVSSTIIEYKIHKEGRKSYFQIIRADGNSQMYYSFSKMLKNYNREDLEVLWKIVKDRFKKVQPVDDMACYLLHTLKTMCKHHVKDSVWKNQQGLAK
nr:hypothetical protein [Tanacetum cinerariifolium]